MKLILQETGQKFTTLLENNNIENITKKRLSVQVSLIGLSFLVTSADGKQEIFFYEKTLSHTTSPEELLYDLEAILADNDIFNVTFEEITVVYSTPIYTIIPSALFDPTRASEYLKFNSKILANDYISHDSLNNKEILVAYVPYININNFLFEKYGAFNYFHSSTVLLNLILEKEKKTIGSKVFLHLQHNHFDCVVLKNGELELCNSYAFKSPEDFIYFTLFCLEQLDLSPENIEVVLCGEVEKDDDNYNIAYTYIRNLNFMKDEFSPITIEDQLPHQNIILKNLA